MKELPGKIARYAFKNLDENSFQERSIGWVNILDILDNRFKAMEYLKEPFLAMSLRIDERKVPRTALKQCCQEAEEKILERKQMEFLPKMIRQEIREDARNRLLKRSIPVSNAYDMIWNMQNGTLIFGSVNCKLCDEFAELFLKTFDLHLEPVFPYALACRFLEKEGTSTDLLDGLPPLRFPGEHVSKRSI
jgi:DNA recombination-dependent growth factor C